MNRKLLTGYMLETTMCALSSFSLRDCEYVFLSLFLLWQEECGGGDPPIQSLALLGSILCIIAVSIAGLMGAFTPVVWFKGKKLNVVNQKL